MLLGIQPSDEPKLERNLLKDQVKERLRDYIISGRTPPGTKLAERELAELLEVSRAPVRDALLELENEGLVVTKSTGRCVVELGEQDIHQLFQVRLALERLAVQLAAQHTTPESRSALLAKHQELEEAVTRRDEAAYPRANLETHCLICRQAQNPYLLRMYTSIIGPLSMFVSNNSRLFDWGETLAVHADLVHCINSGDAQAAVRSIERHLDRSLHHSLQAFGAAEPLAEIEAGRPSAVGSKLSRWLGSLRKGGRLSARR